MDTIHVNDDIVCSIVLNLAFPSSFLSDWVESAQNNKFSLCWNKGKSRLGNGYFSTTLNPLHQLDG